MKSVVVIPTYNERENAPRMIATLRETMPDTDVLICDDGSPDGTGELVAEIASKDPAVHLSSGPRKGGLGQAYVRGFSLALERKYDRVLQMDCDFSHDPQDGALLLSALDHYDFALGSRYVFGGGTVNWPRRRKLISRGGAFYARTILGLPIADPTGGFKAWRRETLEAIDLNSIRSNGYAFQIETTYRALRKGFSFVQIPIVFTERRHGATKMSRAIVFEAMLRVWQMRSHKE